MKNNIIFILWISIFPLCLISQENSNLKENYIETLKFGIESQVIDVLDKIIKEEDYQYNSLLLSLISQTNSEKVKELIYRLWTSGKFIDGEEYARAELAELIDDSEESNRQSSLAAISFLAEIRNRESLPLLLEIMDYGDDTIAKSAVLAIGKIADVEDYNISSQLLSRLQKSDPYVEEDLVANIILSLGELQYMPAAEYLLNILEDSDAPEIHRGYACVSIGKIGRSEDYSVIKSVYDNSESAIMRSYAFSSLTEFKNREIAEILIQALKRDPYWRIRVKAAEQIGILEKWPDEVDGLLVYKALNDPISQVRIASITSLGKSELSTSQDFLIEAFTNDKKTNLVRLTALSALIENQIMGTKKAILNVMSSIWDKKNDRLLEFISRDLSVQVWDELGDVYEKMLDHPNWLIKVYGIRAIRKSQLSTPGIDKKLSNMDREGQNELLLKELRSN